MDLHSMKCIATECDRCGYEKIPPLCDSNEKLGDGHDMPWSRFEQVPYAEGVEGTRTSIVRKTKPPSDFLTYLSAKIPEFI